MLVVSSVPQTLAVPPYLLDAPNPQGPKKTSTEPLSPTTFGESDIYIYIYIYIYLSLQYNIVKYNIIYYNITFGEPGPGRPAIDDAFTGDPEPHATSHSSFTGGSFPGAPFLGLGFRRV